MNPQGFTLVILDTARHPRGRKYSHFAHKETDVQKGYTANLATELAGGSAGIGAQAPGARNRLGRTAEPQAPEGTRTHHLARLALATC